MRKRNHVIPVRLNARELRELEEQVEKSGLSREEFMRSLILGAQVHAKPCEHHPELLRKIAGLCNNANQLAHVANASGMASALRRRGALRQGVRHHQGRQDHLSGRRVKKTLSVNA